MKKEKISDLLHEITYRKKITSYKKISDFYIDKEECNISNINLNDIDNQKEIISWLLNNPDYDFKSVNYTEFNNSEIFNYLKVYYDDLLFILDKYKKKEFIIRYEDFF
jgi:hypothetical protein